MRKREREKLLRWMLLGKVAFGCKEQVTVKTGGWTVLILYYTKHTVSMKLYYTSLMHVIITVSLFTLKLLMRGKSQNQAEK